jgi:hypothetical protein
MHPTLLPEPNRADPQYQKVYSLGKGAGFLGVSKTTLRGAIERGEVRANKNAQGHYAIPGDEIYQYQARLHEQGVRAGGAEPVHTPTAVPPEEGVQVGVQTGVQSGGAVLSRTDHEEIVGLYKAQIQDREATIDDLRADIQVNRENSRAMVHLLTHDGSTGSNKGSHWIRLILGMAILLIGIAIYTFRQELEELIQLMQSGVMPGQ